MRLSRIYISEKVQAFRRVFNMNKFSAKFRKSVDGWFVSKQIHKETEQCVICGVDTGVPKELDISYRLYYVSGTGQLCHDCWDDTYTTSGR